MKHFDLSHFRKVQSTRSHTIMAHPDGHMIHLAHDNLSEKQMHDLHKLPFEDMKKMAKGGQVKAPGTKSEQDKISKGFKGALGLDEGGQVGVQPVEPFSTEGSIVPEAGIMGASQGQPLIQGQNPPMAGIDAPSKASVLEAAFAPQQAPQQGMATPAPSGNLENAIASQEAGIKGQAGIEGELGRKEAGTKKNLQMELAKVNDLANKDMVDIKGHMTELEDAQRNGKINPHQYMQEQGIVSNLLTGIGLILGGAGAPSTGGRNLAADFIDKQIDNDIKAQMSNRENRQSLLNFYEKKLGDRQAAAEVAKAHLMNMTALTLEQSAALSKDPQAQFRSMQEVGRLRQGANEQLEQSALRTSALKQVRSGNASPEVAVQYLAKTPADKASADKELDYLNAANAGVKSINDSFRKVTDIGPIGANNPLSNSSSTFDGAVATLDQQVRQIMKGQGALSDQDMTAARKWYPSSLDRPEQLAIKQRSLLEFLKSRAEGHTATLKRIGIPVKLDFTPTPLE